MRKKTLTLVASMLLISGVLLKLQPSNLTLQTKAESNLSNPRVADTTSTWDCIYFGNYWQNDTNNDGKADEEDEKEPIKWRVLSVDGDEAFIVSEQALDCKKYSEKFEPIDWKDCTLRDWLNTEFINTAFTSTEQSAINEGNELTKNMNSTDTGANNNTINKIFLLSKEDICNIVYGFNNEFDPVSSDSVKSETRQCNLTQYALSKVYTSNNENGNADYCKWWMMRLSSSGPWYFDVVHEDGSGCHNCSPGLLGVRPALCINLTSSSWSYAGTVTSNFERGIGVTPTTTHVTATPSLPPTATPMPTATPQTTTSALPTTTPTQSEEIGLYKLSDTSPNTKYDVTGDGKPDKIEIKKMNYSSYTYTAFKVVINGKTALEVNNAYYGATKTILINTKDRNYFFISLYGDNSDGPEIFYEYVNDKLVKRADLENAIGKLFYHYTGKIVSVKPDTIEIKVTGQTDMLAGTNLSFTYKVEPNGNLSLDKKIVNVSYNHSHYKGKDWKIVKSKYLIAAKKIPVYRNTTGSKKTFVIQKGTKLQITKVSLKGKGRYYCITKDKKKGWIKNKYNSFYRLAYAG